MGMTHLQPKSCHEVARQSNPPLKKLLASLHWRASEQYGAEYIGELVHDFPESPWFAVNMGSAALVAEYLDETQQIRLKTFDHVDLVLGGCGAEVEAIWAVLAQVAVSQGITSLGAVE